MKLFITALFFLSLTQAWSQNKTFGHNAGHTGYTFKDGDRCSAGSQVIACGTDKFLAGTSPMLLLFYNMLNIYGRYSFNEKWTLELAFFDTYGNRNEGYLMQAYASNLIYTHKLKENFSIHYNAQFQYYTEDLAPFSIRRPTIDRKPVQLNFVTLSEWTLSEDLFLLMEAGLLHLSDNYPKSHLGLSLGTKFDNLVVQFGGSVTSSLHTLYNHPFRHAHDYHLEKINKAKGYDGGIDKEKVRRDVGAHSEITIQYFF